MNVTMEGKYQTKNGNEVEVLRTDLELESGRSVISLVSLMRGGKFVTEHYRDGRRHKEYEDPHDLVPVPELRPYEAVELVGFMGEEVVKDGSCQPAEIVAVTVRRDTVPVIVLSNGQTFSPRCLLNNYRWACGGCCGKEVQ